MFLVVYVLLIPGLFGIALGFGTHQLSIEKEHSRYMLLVIHRIIGVQLRRASCFQRTGVSIDPNMTESPSLHIGPQADSNMPNYFPQEVLELPPLEDKTGYSIAEKVCSMA
jgi:hypothetical protein